MSDDRVKLLRAAHLATLQSVRLLLARLADNATSFYESKALYRLGSELDEVMLNFRSDDSPAILALECYVLKERIDSLFAAIAHGDDKHRAWLKQALEDHFAGRPVEKP